MTEKTYLGLLGLLGLGFAIAFSVIVVPALLETGDVIGAFAAGFVNPFASGYSTDVFMCGAILLVWVVYEARTYGVKHGWIAIVLSFAPGVATGFALYLIIRHRQLSTSTSS